MSPGKVLQRQVCALAFAAGVVACPALLAQEVSLNYERLSSLEEPLATELGDVTLVLTGLVDTPLTVDMEDGSDTHADFIGNVQLTAQTQLPNRWRTALIYFGQYVSDRRLATVVVADHEYTDNVALSVGSYWGTALAGNVSGIVREQTRRRRGAGNASLAFDDVYGKLEDDGGGYHVRFGPWVLGAVVDQDENFDIGVVYQRPTGNRDYRLSARYTDSVYTPEGTARTFSTRAFSAVGEIIYGSTLWDLGAGYEELEAGEGNADRWYVSAGGRMKKGVLSLSVEGHYGQIGSEDEVSAALGIQYDLARGLSANLGLNYAQAKVDRNSVRLMDTKEKQATLSIRYSF